MVVSGRPGVTAGALLGAAWAAKCKHGSVSSWAPLTLHRHCHGHLHRQARVDSLAVVKSCPGSVSDEHTDKVCGPLVVVQLQPTQALALLCGRSCCLARCVQCCGELLRLCYKSTYTASRSASTAVETGVHCPLRHRWGSLCSTLCSAPGGTLWVPLTAAWAC